MWPVPVIQHLGTPSQATTVTACVPSGGTEVVGAGGDADGRAGVREAPVDGPDVTDGESLITLPGAGNAEPSEPVGPVEAELATTALAGATAPCWMWPCWTWPCWT